MLGRAAAQLTRPRLAGGGGVYARPDAARRRGVGLESLSPTPTPNLVVGGVGEGEAAGDAERDAQPLGRREAQQADGDARRRRLVEQVRPVEVRLVVGCSLNTGSGRPGGCAPAAATAAARTGPTGRWRAAGGGAAAPSSHSKG
eukprot:scaffold38680_cov39-Phaeocystis_antarctica.AAC.1